MGQGHVPGPPPAKRGPRGPVRGLFVEGRLVVKVLPSRQLVSESSPQRQTGLWSSLEVGGAGGGWCRHVFPALEPEPGV